MNTKSNNVDESFKSYIKNPIEYKIMVFKDIKLLLNKTNSKKINYYKVFYNLCLYLNLSNLSSISLNKSKKQNIFSKSKNKAKKLLKLYQSNKKLEIISYLYEILLYESKTFDEANLIKEKMKSENIKLSLKIYEFLIKKCTSYEKAIELKKEMIYLGIKPNEYIHRTILILDKLKKQKIKKLRREMAKKLKKEESKQKIPNKTNDFSSNNKNNNIIIQNNKSDLINQYIVSDKINFLGNQHPLKKSITLKRTNRCHSVVTTLKKLYNNTCQICGQKLEIGNNKFYSEVHHIQPLGYHNGPDIIENAIVLCPNHHTLFDKGAITIDINKKTVIHFNKNNILNGKKITLNHSIDIKYINYHNKYIFIPSKNDILFQNAIKEHYPHKINGEIFYGDTVIVQDIKTNEKIKIILESYWNKAFMNEIQRILLWKKIGEIFKFKGYTYKVLNFNNK